MRDDIPQGKAHQLVVQCQIVSNENIHACIIIWTEQVMFWHMHVHIHICMHAVTIHVKEVINFKESSEGVHGRFWREKRS